MSKKNEPKRRHVNLPEFAVGFYFKFSSLEERNEFAQSEQYKRLVGDAASLSTVKNIDYKLFKNP